MFENGHFCCNIGLKNEKTRLNPWGEGYPNLLRRGCSLEISRELLRSTNLGVAQVNFKL